MASKAIGFLNFKFGADLGGFEKAMKKAQKKLSKFGKSVEKTGKNLSTGLTLPLLALGAASIKAFDEQEKAIAQVEAGLKSTGNTVGFTSEKLQEMAADLQKTTLFGDEEILKGATAQLLTFTNITGEQFKKTQAVALDLATRLDGDLKSASIMLGKALNDPVANLSALSRAGIQFSEEQKATVKSMVETNDLAGAQTLILAELEKQYGGSAEAAAQAGLGPITQLKNQLSDLSEQIGARLIPFVKQFTTWLVGLAEKFDNLSESQKDTIVKFALIVAAIGPLLIIIGKMSIGLSALIPIFIKVGTFLLANPYVLLAAAIAAVAYAIYDFTSALNLQIDVQKELGDLNNKAQKSISKDLSNIDLLTTAIKDENTSLEDKKRLLNELKSTYPGYYDEIDETSLSTKELNAATLTLTKSLMQTARLTAYKDKLTEINKKMIELENRDGVDLSTNLITEGGLLVVLGPLGKIIGDATGATEKLKNSIQEKIDTNEYEELSKLQQKITDETIELEKEVNKTSTSFEKLSHNTKDVNTTIETTNDEVAKTTNSLEKLEPILLKIKNVEDSFEPNIAKSFNTEKVEAYRGALGTLVDQISVLTNISAPELEDALMSTMTKLGDNLAQGAESFQEFGESVKGMMRDIIGGIISQGIATAITAALSSPAIKINPFLIPVIAGAAAGLARTAFNSLIPAFAEGGLVTGPTTALIGEGVGTNAGNPEVVAPLDKLKSMMGGGNNSNITVTGKLIGSDIFLSNQNASNNRLRTT
tara:strand:+ start:221 stop:2509 length:2289 start_codon:yes stop_codon:yes gene_type:complete